MKYYGPEAKNLEWWPAHVQKALTNLGEVLGKQQLNPSMLDWVSREGLQGHEIRFSHIPGKEMGGQKGKYTLDIIGPIYEGRWMFSSGFLDALARAAAKTSD